MLESTIAVGSPDDYPNLLEFHRATRNSTRLTTKSKEMKTVSGTVSISTHFQTNDIDIDDKKAK
jgi:hypothetical protein